MKISKRQKSSVIKRTRKLQIVLCVFLLATMILPFIPEGALDVDAFQTQFGPVTSYTSATNEQYISGKPGVYIMGDGYAIIWVTTFNGMGWVTYKKDGKEVTINDERNGLLRTYDYIHVVKVPLEDYDALCTGYTVHSKEVTGHSYGITTGDVECSYSTKLKDTKPDSNDTVRALVLTDIHGRFDGNGNVANASRAYNGFKTFKGLGKSADPTLVIFPGDTVDYIDEKRLKLMFEIMGNTTYGQYPIVYCRGNHEFRGIDSTKLLDYLPTKTGEFYYDFTYGSLWGVVIDTGEERPDTHQYQGLLANYRNYLAKEENWLRGLKKPTTDPETGIAIKYRLGVHHMPNLESLGRKVDCDANNKVTYWYPGVNITDSMKHLDLQFAVAGHVHKYRIYDNSIMPSGELTPAEEAAGTTVKGSTKTLVDTYNNQPRYQFGGYDKFVKADKTNIEFVKSSLNHKTFTAGGDWNGVAFVALENKNNKYEARLFAGHSDLSYKDFAVNANGNRYTSDDEEAGNKKYVFGEGDRNEYIIPLASERNLTAIAVDEETNYARTNQIKVANATWNSNYNLKSGSALAAPGVNTDAKAIIKGTPAVIESGGDWYNVVWITENQSAGYVHVNYNGKAYLFYDEVGGKLRSNDVVHTVKVPKEYLNNNKYYVVSYLVTHSPENATYTNGEYSSSPEYLFEDRSNDKTPNILLYGNFKNWESNTDVGELAQTLANKAIEGLSTDFSFVAATGDLCFQTLGTERPNGIQAPGTDSCFRDFFVAATTLSKGNKLVVVSRGNSECRGFYATELIKYIPTVTGEFYYAFNYGDYTFVNIDTAEDAKEDTDYYNGRVKTKALYTRENEWLDSILADKDNLKENIAALSHKGLYTMDYNETYSHLNLHWGYKLRRSGALINLLGDSQEPGLLQDETTERELFSLYNGGFNHGNATYGEYYNYGTAASVLLSSDYAYVTFCQIACDDNELEPTCSEPFYKSYGNTRSIDDALDKGQKVYDLVTSEVISYSAKAPSYFNDTDGDGYNYTISTPAHLLWLSQQTQSNSDPKHFENDTFTLANDIDLMLYPFTPIGGYDASKGVKNQDKDDGAYDSSKLKYFSGIFDGNGYKIKNLNILPKDTNGNIYYASTRNNPNTGLFGAVKKGQIKNLTVEGGFVKGGWYTGALAGRVQSTSSKSADTIINCYTNVTVFAPGEGENGADRAGGFIGYIYDNVKIEKCANFGNVKITRDDGSVGGLVGSSYWNANTTRGFKILNCFNRGTVYGRGNADAGYTGGILGFAVTTYGEIKNCYNAAPIWGTNSAGIIAEAKNTSGASLLLERNYVVDLGRGPETLIATKGYCSTNNSQILTYSADVTLKILYSKASRYISTDAGVACTTAQLANLNDIALIGSSTLTTDGAVRMNTAGDGETVTENYKLPTTSEVGIRYNNGYPIHTGSYFYAPKSYSDDPILAGEATHVNEQFAVKDENGNYSNLTDLKDMPANSSMYVLVGDSTPGNGNPIYFLTYNTAIGTSTLTNAASDGGLIKTFIWTLTKNSDGTFKFTPFKDENYNLTMSGISAWNLTKSSGDNKYKIYSGSNYLSQNNTTTTLGKTQTEWFIFPILQDRDNGATFGFSGRSSWQTGGKGGAGITSTITSLSRATAHKVDMNYGKFTIQRDSVFGNNISLDSKLAAVDGHDAQYKAQVLSPTVVASDSSSQLMDLKCNQGNGSYMLWNISLTTNYGLESTSQYYLTLWNTTTSTRFSRTAPFVSGNSGDTVPATQYFFIVYSLNSDGGYYILPLTGEEKLETVGVSTGTKTNLVVSSYNSGSEERFWIQANKREVEVEVVDAYAEVSNVNGKAEFKVTSEKNATRFTTSLKYGSAAYFDAPRAEKPKIGIGFKKDSYVSKGYSYVGGTDAYTGDCAPGVTFDNTEFYRYFRPHVYAVTFKGQPGSASTTTKPIYLDHTDLIAEAKTDSKFTLKGNFTITFNSSGGTSVSNQPYNWTIKEFQHGGTTYEETRAIVDKLKILKYDIIANPTEAVINPVDVEWKDPTLDLTQYNPTRDKHVFYGWAKGESGKVKTISSDNDIIKTLTGVTNNTTVVNAFWAGADFSGMKEKRGQTLTAALGIYSNTTKQSGTFSKLSTNGTIEWHRLTVGNPTGSKITTGNSYGIQVADQGSGLKAVFKYSGAEIDLAYSALIPTAQIVDGKADDDYQKAIFVDKNVTATIAANAKNQKVELSASNFVISGVGKNTTGLTYKVYGVLSNGTEILLFSNGETALPSYIGKTNGGVSYEGISFTKYAIYFTNSKASSVAVNSTNFALTVNPYIYKVNYEENGYQGKIQYLIDKSYIDGERAKDSGEQSYYYDEDLIRVVVNQVAGSKISAGSYITVGGERVYPTYTTGTNIIFDYFNEYEYLIHKTDKANKIRIQGKDLNVSVHFKDETNKLNLNSININIGPLGAKRYVKDGSNMIRFGTVWYLDDVVSQNKWYRGYGYGSYIIMFKNLLKTEANNDFYDYIKKTYPSTYSTIVSEWNSYSNGTAITDAKKQEFFKYLTDFIAYWNKQGEADKLSKINFGSAAIDVPANYYYYRDGKEIVDGMSVKDALKAYIEFSAVLEVPAEYLNRELVYLPYASYVYQHDSGYFVPHDQKPDNVYQFKAPEKIYTYNSLGSTHQ